MDKNSIRISKIVKIIGMIDIMIFSLTALFFSLTDNSLAAIFFIPFIALGIVLLLAYKRQRIIIEDDKLTFYYLIKKKQQIRYTDIHCLLLIPLNHRIQKTFIDKQYNRLVTLDETLANLDVLFEILEQKGIQVLNFGEMVENSKDVKEYLNVLTAMERYYYRSICTESKTIENMSEEKTGFNVAKTKKALKIAGWVLIVSNLAAFLIGGKTMLLLLIAILLTSYAIYLKYYPYIYLETTSKKGQKAFQMPVLGASIALLLCIAILNIYSYDFGDYMKMTMVTAILLAIPYMIKSARTTVPQRLGRKLSVLFAVFMIAFAITFPINFLLTFDKPTHESTIITDKYISTAGKTTDYYLYGNWDGEEKEFTVSKSEYNNTSIGDLRTVCIKQSILGLEYYTVHE